MNKCRFSSASAQNPGTYGHSPLTHPLEMRNRCRGGTPSHAVYTPPRGLATKTTRLYYSYRIIPKRRVNKCRQAHCCLQFQPYSTAHTVWVWYVVVPVSKLWFPLSSLSVIIGSQTISFSTVDLLFMKPTQILNWAVVLAWNGDCYCLLTSFNNKHIHLYYYLEQCPICCDHNMPKIK